MYIKKSKATRQSDSDGIIKALHLSVKRTTVTQAIHKLGYRRCVARRRPLLKPLDLKHHLAFAKAHTGKNWTVEDWKCVIWTDEMSIKIGDERKDIMGVWRKPGEEFHQDCKPKKTTWSGNDVLGSVSSWENGTWVVFFN